MLMVVRLLIDCVVLSVAAVGAAFGLKRGLHMEQLRPEALEHGLDHMIGPYAKYMVPNLGRQMPVAEVPREAREMPGIRMPDLNHGLRGRSYPQPPSVFELQPVFIGHGNGLRKIEEDFFPLVGREANAPAMTLREIESQDSGGLVSWPVSGRAMPGRALQGHIST
jgi:hypothetical protein